MSHTDHCQEILYTVRISEEELSNIRQRHFGLLQVQETFGTGVSPEQKPKVFEVNALRDQVPLIAMNKLHKINSLTEAWNILDQLYGQSAVIRSKLKGKIMSL